MSSATGPDPRPFGRSALVGSRPRVRTRGVNRLAELEALVILGGGRFEVGVRFIANVFEDVPLAEQSGRAVPNPFAGREDVRQWVVRIYEDDDFRLRRMGSSVSVALSHLLGVAWDHVPSTYRERVAARLAQLPDDAMARAWRARGEVPYWEPPAASGVQTHFVEDLPHSPRHLDVPR